MSNIKLGTATPKADTPDPIAVVTLDPAPPPGKTMRFSLVVVDDLGNESQPAFVDVEVRELPKAVITGPQAVALGAVIQLVGKDSTPAGHIKTYRWQLMPEVHP